MRNFRFRVSPPKINLGKTLYYPAVKRQNRQNRFQLFQIPHSAPYTFYMALVRTRWRATTFTSTWCLLETFRALRGSGDPRRVMTGSMFGRRGGYNNGM